MTPTFVTIKGFTHSETHSREPALDRVYFAVEFG